MEKDSHPEGRGVQGAGCSIGRCRNIKRQQCGGRCGILAVRVDGTAVGVTPYENTNMTTGEHTVVVTHPDGRKQTSKVMIDASTPHHFTGPI